MEPDFERLYTLGESHTRGHMRAHQVHGGFGHAELRAICRAEQPPPAEPVAFKRDTGSRRVDFVGTTWGPPVYLVSQRFVDVLTEGGFRGWGLWPITLVDKGKEGEPISGYHGLSIGGRCGPTDESLSEYLPGPQGRPSRPARRRGLYFREGWDGSDVFMPPNTDWKIVTEEVKQALEAAGATGFRLRRLTEIELLG